MFTYKTKRFITMALIAIAIVAQGCSSGTPTEVTLTDLVASLQISVGANASAGDAQFSRDAVRRAATFENEPAESEFSVLGPNLNVFAWPIIQDTPISARWGSSIGETMNLSWPGDHFPSDTWPDLDVAGGTRFGNTWVVYPAGGDADTWVAQHTEWIRRPHEQAGTTFPFEVKLEADEPCDDCPIGQFIAGPSRHVTDQPAFRRRTAIKWFRYGDLTAWDWEGAPGAVDPPAPDPDPEPTPIEVSDLEQIVVFIQDFTVTSANGATISFDNVNSTVNLATLRGDTTQVAAGEVPRGTFGDIRVNVDAAQSYVVVAGAVKALTFSADPVVVNGPITVGETTTTIRLVFNLDESLTENADGSWTMAPVVVLTVVTA